ncbi:MAG: DUF3791 domain-containing protein [Candidatus Margulisbacteria bacterium]|jgi:hypothetical protein|nr:DUF3791 domain-containing protein [Candidatus Margulisiibacteriota bacterium]
MNTETKKTEFVSFCIEMYAKQNKVSGAAAAKWFEQSGAINYLFANYEALHTQGWNYILAAIENFIAAEEKK